MQEILALKGCHSTHPVSKFWGVCNDAKYALDACFRREKLIKRCVNWSSACDRVTLQSQGACHQILTRGALCW